MMMPANYSAIAENEMTYVIGGGIVDVLAPALTEADWQRFNTNLVTIIGNTYLSNFIAGTVGKIFTGTYSPKNGVITGYAGVLSGIWNGATANRTAGWDSFKGGVKGALNIGLNIVGNAAAIYNLATANVKNAANATLDKTGAAA